MSKRRLWKKKILTTSKDRLERLYFKEVGKRKVLSSKDEQKLAEVLNVVKGDERIRIRNLLVEGNLPYVIALATTYNNRGIPILDLIQAGNEALILSADKMIPGKARLTYYAREGIKGAMTKLFNGKGVVDIPGISFTHHNKFYGAQEKLKHRLGRDPDFEEIIEEADLTKSEGEIGISAGCRTVSLNSKKFNEDESGDEDQLSSFIDDRINLVKSTYEDERRETIEKCLKCLTNRERKIIIRHYGLFENESQTLEDIARTLGVTGSAIGLVKQKALQKLAHPKRAKFLKPFLDEVLEREIS